MYAFSLFSFVHFGVVQFNCELPNFFLPVRDEAELELELELGQEKEWRLALPVPTSNLLLSLPTSLMLGLE